jgi:hypothetical protein
MTSCEDIRPILGAYADGQLSALENDAVVVHLEECGRCRQIVRDQQQVQHVLDAWALPAVSGAEWAEMGKRLRAELEEKGDPIVLKTRPHTEALDATPVSTPALAPDEVREPPQRPAEPVRPAARRWWAKTPAKTPAAPTILKTTVVRVPSHRALRFRWVAHGLGAAAAALLVYVSAVSYNPEPVAPTPSPVKPPVEAYALAQPLDVDVMDIEMLDPQYNVGVSGGDASEAVRVWVVLSAG